MRSQQHILVREDDKVHMEITFITSSFKSLAMRDDADVPNDKFLVERSTKFLEYYMVGQFHVLNNLYHIYFCSNSCG
jgi:hypothetical protein